MKECQSIEKHVTPGNIAGEQFHTIKEELSQTSFEIEFYVNTI